MAEHGYTLPASALYHRLVWLPETPARYELMIIYMEDPADSGGSAQPSGDSANALLQASLERAGKSITIR